MKFITNLKKARKGTGLTALDFSNLLDTDISNLSKYERRVKVPPLRVILGYHILTTVSLDDLFQYYVHGIADSIINNVHQMIVQLKEQEWNNKIGERIRILEELHDRVSCLKQIDEHES